MKIDSFSSVAYSSSDRLSGDIFEPLPSSSENGGSFGGAETFSDGVEWSSLVRGGGDYSNYGGLFDSVWGADKTKTLKPGEKQTIKCPEGTTPVVTTGKDGTVVVVCKDPSERAPILD